MPRPSPPSRTRTHEPRPLDPETRVTLDPETRDQVTPRPRAPETPRPRDPCP